MEPGGRRHLGCDDGDLYSGLSLGTRVFQVQANRALWPLNAPVIRTSIDSLYPSPNTVNSAHLIGVVCDPRLNADSILALY